MARQAISSDVYIRIGGKDKLWYSVSEDGKITWHLPKDIKEKKQILNNISNSMCEYVRTG